MTHSDSRAFISEQAAGLSVSALAYKRRLTMQRLLPAKLLIVAALLNPVTHLRKVAAEEGAAPEAGQPVAHLPVALRQGARPAVLLLAAVALWDRQTLAQWGQARPA
jgi:hypothetical protein